MNFRRGFRRLFFVLTILYFLIGGTWLAVIRSNDVDYWQRSLDQCFVGAHETGPPLTEQSCRSAWPYPTFDWGTLVALVLFPVLLYGVWKLLGWIGRGFQHHPA
jgi:hypothetical protein